MSKVNLIDHQSSKSGDAVRSLMDMYFEWSFPWEKPRAKNTSYMIGSPRYGVLAYQLGDIRLEAETSEETITKRDRCNPFGWEKTPIDLGNGNLDDLKDDVLKYTHYCLLQFKGEDYRVVVNSFLYPTIRYFSTDRRLAIITHATICLKIVELSGNIERFFTDATIAILSCEV